MDNIKLAQLLETQSEALIGLAQQRDEALGKLAHYEAREKAVKLAQVKIAKGIAPDNFEEMVKELYKLAMENPQGFDTHAEAVGMVGPQLYDRLDENTLTPKMAGSNRPLYSLDAMLMS